MLSGSVQSALVKIVPWLRARDAGLSALRRSARAAIVMPALFALCEEVIGNLDRRPSRRSPAPAGCAPRPGPARAAAAAAGSAPA